MRAASDRALMRILLIALAGDLSDSRNVILAAMDFLLTGF
jgi:hypothetical protein